MYFIILSHASFAQNISKNNISELQKMLLENPSLLENLDTRLENLDTSNTSNTINLDGSNKKYLDLDSNLKPNNVDIKDKKIEEISILKQYYKDLSGEVLEIFGESEFNYSQGEKILSFNSFGEDYKLAPGDIIEITLRGLKSSTSKYLVKNNGSLTLEDLLPISVNGLTVAEVKNIIWETLLIDDASASVFVTLDTARLITVKISGGVKKPKTISVPAYTPLSRILAFSGGISDYGSLRNIYLNQESKKAKKVDFYDFLLNPYGHNDPVISNNAQVFVANKGATVSVGGFASRSGIFELSEGDDSISVDDLLKYSGTNFIPPGATLNIQKFDINGNATSKIVNRNSIVRSGENLKIAFIKTLAMNTSKIKGAVLDDYSINFEKPISIKQALKDGAVLKPEAFTAFAMITGRNIQNRAISIDQALIDETIMLPVGANLTVLDHKSYRKLVLANLTNTEDALVAELGNTDVIELYLNAKRIAYIPPHKNRNLSVAIRDFYKPNIKTVDDIVILKTGTKTKAVYLNEILSLDTPLSLSPVDSIFIFEDKFYKHILQSYSENNKSNDSNQINDFQSSCPLTESQSYGSGSYSLDEDEEFTDPQQKSPDLQQKSPDPEYCDRIDFTKKIIEKSNTLNISLDNNLIAILPTSENFTSNFLIDKINNYSSSVIKELVIISNLNSDINPEIKNLNFTFPITGSRNINLITQKEYENILRKFDDESQKSVLLSLFRRSDAVKIYYDDILSSLVPPHYKVHEINLLKEYNNSQEIYRLFASRQTKYKINENVLWNTNTFNVESFFSASNDLTLTAKESVNFYSKDFIRNQFGINNKDDTTSNAKVSKDFANNEFKTNMQSNLNLRDNVFVKNNAQIDRPNLGIAYNKEEKKVANDINIMFGALRLIEGAVQFPGNYPIVGDVSLTNIINTVGGILDYADISNIVISKAPNEDGKLSKIVSNTYDLNKSIADDIILSGLYSITFPNFVNDAIVGSIAVKGEVQIPGNYTFGRSETIYEVLERAGGFTETAFPFGAILTRESAKEQEKLTNILLANQLEASILKLAQSDLENAADQIKAVLGFAEQLKNQEVSGRVSFNSIYNRDTSLVYVEDKDELYIPKRPSHVSIVGSVARTTTAQYRNSFTVKDYLIKAGGLTKMADKSAAYVLLANGESRAADSQTIIPAGSVIVIPPKTDKLSLLGMTNIVSRILGNIATSILAINNVK